MTPTNNPNISGLDHVAICVKDLDASAKWYHEVLGLEDVFPGRWGGVPRMMLSVHDDGQLGTGVALFPISSSPKPHPQDGKFSHFAFRSTPQEFDAWKRRLENLGVSFEEQDHEISTSIYFKDPDGILVEITHYGPLE